MNNFQEQTQEDRTISNKTFLKKGTRQFLSSGIDKKNKKDKKKKRIPDDIDIHNESTLRNEADTTPKTRSISQNRVITKRRDDRSCMKNNQPKERK